MSDYPHHVEIADGNVVICNVSGRVLRVVGVARDLGSYRKAWSLLADMRAQWVKERTQEMKRVPPGEATGR